MSINSIYRESVAMEPVHHAKVALCAVPGDPPFLKYSWFENRDYVLDLEAVLRRCSHLDYLQLHIPEYQVNRVSNWLAGPAQRLLAKAPELHLNVMLQNIDLIQGEDLAGLKRFGTVTCTTAHEAYTNAETRGRLGVTLHRLSICNGPEFHTRSGYHDKEYTLMVSHDEHPLKDLVLSKIEAELPKLRIQIVRDLFYGDYAKLAARVKWSLTFGEGLDAYFVDPVFSGGVSFAVFNERFFTPGFANVETVYPSWEVLIDRITDDLQRLDEPVAYERCRRLPYDLLADLYSTERFRENLRMFYRGKYTFP